MGRIIRISKYAPLAFLMACASGVPKDAPPASDATRNSEPQSTPEVEQASTVASLQQGADSTITAMIPPDGGTVELAGFATVIFPAGAFDSPREVTVAATNDPGEDIFFRFDVGTGSVDHEIRIFTGSESPAVPIDVSLTVPQEFLDQVPTDKAPVTLVKTRSVRPLEVNFEYQLLESDYDEKRHTTRARLLPMFFAEHQPGEMQVILRISSALRRE